MSNVTMTSLEPYIPPVEANARRRWVELMKPAAELAQAIAGTDFVPARIRQNPGAIAACVLYGDEVGLGPMQSLAKIHVIEGTPALAAESMRALILAAGHDLWVEESTVSRVTLAGKRRDSQQVSKVTYTLDDARRANLAGRQNWRTYPRQMLMARATAELARNVFADAIAGLSALEEFDEDAFPRRTVEAASAGAEADGRRRRRDRPSAAAAPRPADQPEDEPAELPPLPGGPGYEPGSDEPTEAQRRALHAEFRRRSLDRDERLAWVGHFLERPISSFNELTASEHSRVLERLAADDIPYGAPEEPAEAPLSEEGGGRPDEAALGSTPPSSESGPAATLSLAIFKARLAGERFGRDLVAQVGRELYPGRSLEQLTDEERATLMETLLERRGEVIE